MLISRRDTPAQHALALILANLVIVIRNLKPVSRREQIQVQDVLAAGLEVHSVKEALAVAGVMDVVELGRIEETFGSDTLGRQKVPELRSSETQTDVPSGHAEVSKGRVYIPEGPPDTESRASSDLRHQTALVPKFGRRCSRGGFHALNGVGGKLCGKDLALLVADGLT